MRYHQHLLVATLLGGAAAAALPGCKTSQGGARLKTLDTVNGAADGCQVLVVMSDKSTLTAVAKTPVTAATKAFEFGYLLDEMTVPVQALLAAGCQVSFATPSGAQPIRDPQGDFPLYFTDGLPSAPKDAGLLDAALAQLRLDQLIPGPEAATELAGALSLVSDQDSPIRGHGPGSFDTPARIADFLRSDQNGDESKLAKFNAIFMPGGYAPMLDLWNNAELGALLRWFHSTGRLTVTLCRGGVTLASAKQDDSDWIYSGYNMTTYSTVEDNVASVIGKILPFYDLPFHPNQKLKDNGGNVSFLPFHSYVVEDRELITGENQWSAHALAVHFTQALKQRGAVQ